MSTFLKKCLWFLGIVVLLNILYLVLMLNFSPPFKKVYQISRFENKKYDLLVVGNSMALDGIDTDYLSQQGINSYNLALAGNHISTSYKVLDHYLKHNTKPKTVIIGLSSAIGSGYLNKVPFSNPEVEFFYNPSLISNLKNPPLLNFQWLAVDMMKIIISKDHRNAQLVRGQWRTKKTIPDNSTFQDKPQQKKIYTDIFLSKIIELCESQGIKIILVELPGSNARNNNLPFEYTAQLAGNKTKTVYNLNNTKISTAIINPSTDWLAADHLNQFGAKKVTAYLLKYVIRNTTINGALLKK